MKTTQKSKKVLQAILVAIVVFGLIGAYLAPLFSGGVRQQLPPPPTETFTGPMGPPTVNGPSAPPRIQDSK